MTQIGDSSTPPPTYPAADGWGFYIGGDTPHVWTDAEVTALPVRYRLPIFTRSNPGSAPQAVGDARAALMWAVAHGQPKGTLIALDFEAAINDTYLDAFDSTIAAGGYKLVLYGQQSTVLRNREPTGGYWVADWDGVDDDPSWAGKQYRNTAGWDLSDFAASAPLWDTRPAPAAPAPTHQLEEDNTMKLYSAPRSAAAGAEKDVFAFGNGKYAEVKDPGIYKDLLALGWQPEPINYPTHAWLLATWGGTPATG